MLQSFHYSTCLLGFAEVNHKVAYLYHKDALDQKKALKYMNFYLCFPEVEIISGFCTLYMCFYLIPRSPEYLLVVIRKLLGLVTNL